MSFETTAELSISVADSELRSAREDIEDALGDISVGVDPAISGPPTRNGQRRADGSGGPSRAARESLSLAEQRTADVRDIRDILVSAASDGFGPDRAPPGGGPAEPQPGPGIGDAPVADGALSPQRQRRITRQSYRLERRRTESVADIVDILEDDDFGGGSGGGSAGGGAGGGVGVAEAGTSLLALRGLTGAGGGLAGKLGGLASILGGTGGLFGGVLAGGALAGLGLREVFEDFSFDESELEVPAEEFDLGIAQTISEQLPTLDLNDVSETLRTEGIAVESPDDLNREAAAAIADELPDLNTEQVLDVFDSVFDLNIDQSDLESRFAGQNVVGGVGTRFAQELADTLPQIEIREVFESLKGEVAAEDPGDIDQELASLLADQAPSFDTEEILTALAAEYNLEDPSGDNPSNDTLVTGATKTPTSTPGANVGAIGPAAPTEDLTAANTPAVTPTSTPGESVGAVGAAAESAEINNSQQIDVTVETDLSQVTDEAAEAVRDAVGAVRDDLEGRLDELEAELAGIRRAGPGRR